MEVKGATGEEKASLGSSAGEIRRDRTQQRRIFPGGDGLACGGNAKDVKREVVLGGRGWGEEAWTRGQKLGKLWRGGDDVEGGSRRFLRFVIGGSNARFIHTPLPLDVSPLF